jgi:hypothetical protein
MNENDEKIEMKPKTININVNGMPEKIFADWNKSCIENYGDSRWVKMFSDHQKAKQFDEILNLYSRAIDEMDQLKETIEHLFSEVEKLKQSRNESGVQTLGGVANS